MKKLRWCTTKHSHDYMKLMQERNLSVSLSNPNENWMAVKLATTDHAWTRQAIWGYRLFDFWNSKLGIAVEVDGPEHDYKYDCYRDEYNFRRSGIVVLRVKNKDEREAQGAVNFIWRATTLETRKELIGIAGNGKDSRRKLTRLPYPPSFLKQFIQVSGAAPFFEDKFITFCVP